jgi:hypothetical protein
MINQTAAYRWQVAARSLAAIVGGFSVAALTGIVIALGLAHSGLMAGPAAVSLMTLISWLIWSLVAMWAFHASSVGRLWQAILAYCSVASALAWWMGPL